MIKTDPCGEIVILKQNKRELRQNILKEVFCSVLDARDSFELEFQKMRWHKSPPKQCTVARLQKAENIVQIKHPFIDNIRFAT